MELRQIELSKLNAAEYNPRVELCAGDPEYEKLKRSIGDFGCVEAIVWNERSGNIVGGHQTVKALRDLGETTALVSVVNLDEKDEKLLNVILNKIKGDWDREKLKEVLSGFEPDDALLSGFDAQEISLLLARNDDVEEYLDDFDFGDDGEGESEFEAQPGTSYVVSLVFSCNSDAREWAQEHGFKKSVKEGKSTTVIRME